MNIGIVEDETITSDFLAAVCRKEFGAEVVVREARGKEGLRKLREAKPDLAIVDISLPDMDGLEVAKAVLMEIPKCRVLAFSAMRDPLTMIRVTQWGLHGFVDKRELSIATVKGAIQTVMQGKRYFAAVVERSLAELRKNPRPFHLRLTEYEQRLLVYFVGAYTDDEIGVMLDLKSTTVQSRRRDIMRKLDLHSTPKLIKYASDMGFARLELYLPHRRGMAGTS